MDSDRRETSPSSDAPTTRSNPQPGTVGRYQLIRLLGRGGMGEVYLARDPVLDREVALKVLGIEFDDADARQRLVREARAAGKLRHPNIVTVFDAGEDNGRSYIAMEYVPGETLGALIRRRAPLSIGRKLELIEGAGDGLAHAHRISVVHLDIKPDNLMLDEAGTVRVLDFGIARVLRSDAEATRSLSGTLRYMAPEQLQGRQINHRTDVYSLGCSLFELASGVPPFTGSTHEVVTRITGGPTPRLIEVAPETDPRLDALVSRAMALSPENRHADMDELRADLATLRGQLGSAPATAGMPGSRPFTEIGAVRPLRRLALWTGGCVLVGIVGALGFWTFFRQSVPKVPTSDPATVAAVSPPQAPSDTAPSPVVPKPTGKPGNDSDDVWRLLASGDREGVLRRLRSTGANSLKAPLTADVIEAVRGSVQRTRLEANGRSAAEAASYRRGEERLAEANRLAKADRPFEALGAFWEAGDLYRQSVRADPGTQISTTQVPAPPPALPTGDAARTPPTVPAAAAADLRTAGRAASGPATPLPAPSDADAILEVLHRYERAYEARDVVAVQKVFPGLDRDQVAQLQKTFASMGVYQIDIRNPEVRVGSGTASVRAEVARHLVPKVGQAADSVVQNEFQLRRQDNEWVIVGITALKPTP